MPLEERAAQMLARIDADPACSVDAIFSQLSRLLDAPAPANSCGLPGAVGDVIRELAGEFGLALSNDPRIDASGCLAIEIGGGGGCDLFFCAHMDRPCFRVLDLAGASLYPLCAVRVPGADYRCGGMALRYRAGRVTIAARGMLHFRAIDGSHNITFEAESGALQPGDTVMMHALPKRVGDRVMGTGLDNAAGVLIALLAARTLNSLARDLKARGKKIIFAFSDQEEGPPDGLFGQGAARLARALPPPRLGFINVDGHNLEAAAGHKPGIGASHAFVSGFGRGSVVPMDYQALATALSEAVNQRRPGSVRLNYGYVSRSDDMLLSLWARCLGLCGPVVANPHTTEETVALGDLRSAAMWLSVLAQALL